MLAAQMFENQVTGIKLNLCEAKFNKIHDLAPNTIV